MAYKTGGLLFDFSALKEQSFQFGRFSFKCDIVGL